MRQQSFGISKNVQMQEILKMIEKIALSDVNLILIGEQGTGKEWLARTIHQASLRAYKPFWPIDCESILPENFEKELFGYEAVTQKGIIINRGAFEDAFEGTLLINHIENLPLETQKKLGHALKSKATYRVGNEQAIPIDVRVIVTIGDQPDSLMAKRMLLKNMFYRISPIVIEVPPLRDRREDIPLFIEKYIAELAPLQNTSVEGITPSALELCLSYDWPGNIRNLRNAIEYALVMSSGAFIQPEHLPNYLQSNRTKKTYSLSVH